MVIIGVVKMATSKHHIASSLQSAKVWIDQAGESFSKDADIRGELNLFLAQAELQHAREVNLHGRWSWKYPILRQTMALFLAVAVVAGGVYWWDTRSHVPQLEKRQPPVAEPVAPLPLQTAESASPATITPRALPVETPAVNPATAETYEPVKERQVSVPSASKHTTDNTVQLAPEEMQQLIRAAGRSLRGQ